METTRRARDIDPGNLYASSYAYKPESRVGRSKNGNGRDAPRESDMHRSTVIADND